MLHKMILTPSVLVATAIAALATTSTASAGKLGCLNPSDCRCELSSQEVDVEKSCFEVECKTICIPKVVFPWQTGHSCFGFGLFGCDKSACDSCDTPACDASGSAGKACDTSVHNGAFTKTIKVLSKRSIRSLAASTFGPSRIRRVTQIVTPPRLLYLNSARPLSRKEPSHSQRSILHRFAFADPL